MKYFLVVFDRGLGSIVRLSEFSVADDAMTARFAAETEFVDNADMEIVVLGAASEEALHRTHGRYFYSARELLISAMGKLGNGDTEAPLRLA